MRTEEDKSGRPAVEPCHHLRETDGSFWEHALLSTPPHRAVPS
jgi:hypothetical protein